MAGMCDKRTVTDIVTAMLHVERLDNFGISLQKQVTEICCFIDHVIWVVSVKGICTVKTGK